MDEPTRTGALLLVMGPAGAGKTTLARRIAERICFDYIEGDAYHPPANVAKMRDGIALDDADRGPWLDALRRALSDAIGAGRSAVVACSCLRRAYRERLLGGLPRVGVVFLHTRADVLYDRIAHRSGHYMPAALLDSQLDTLEPPLPVAAGQPLAFVPWQDRALFLRSSGPVDALVEAVLGSLSDAVDRGS